MNLDRTDKILTFEYIKLNNWIEFKDIKLYASKIWRFKIKEYFPWYKN